jgi:hypothetical protein
MDIVSEDYYNQLTDIVGNIVAHLYPECTPLEEYNRVLTYHNVSISLKNPMKSSIRYTILAGGGVIPSYFNTVMNFSNINIHDIYQGPIFMFYCSCTPLDVVYYSNSVMSNYFSNSFFFAADSCKKVVFENITLKDVSVMQYQSAIFRYIEHIEMRGLTIQNYTGSIAPVSSIMEFASFDYTPIIIDGLNVIDSQFSNTKIFQNSIPFESFALYNVKFSNVSLGYTNSAIVLSNIKHFDFANHTYEKIWNADEKEESVILNIKSLDMHSDYPSYDIKVRNNLILNMK